MVLKSTHRRSEYLFYWHLRQDGCIDFKIKLSGELSTNLLSDGEDKPSHGVIVSPGVNAQIHQHMFCVRLDMAVGSQKNTVTEVDVVSEPLGDDNPFMATALTWYVDHHGLGPLLHRFYSIHGSHLTMTRTLSARISFTVRSRQRSKRNNKPNECTMQTRPGLGRFRMQRV